MENFNVATIYAAIHTKPIVPSPKLTTVGQILVISVFLMLLTLSRPLLAGGYGDERVKICKKMVALLVANNHCNDRRDCSDYEMVFCGSGFSETELTFYNLSSKQTIEEIVSVARKEHQINRGVPGISIKIYKESRKEVKNAFFLFGPSPVAKLHLKEKR